MTQCLDTPRELPRSAIESSALFFDVDGTLLEIAPRPDAVHVPDELRSIIERIAPMVDGAIALVSGRALADLDALFAPLRLPAVGVHGAEVRTASGVEHRADSFVPLLDPARVELRARLNGWPGCLLEDKRYALTVHYREAPQFAEPIAQAVRDAARAIVDAPFTVLPGKCVFELKPVALTKASGIAALLAVPPFTGRRPIFVGDDVTDESGFEYVNALGGVSVRIGPGDTLAQYRIATVQELRSWLAMLARNSETSAA